MDLSDYQRESQRTNQNPSDDPKGLMISLLGLAGETGSLLTEYKKFFREGERYKVFSHQVSEELGDILWYLADIAARMNLDLNEVAEENLAKLSERWAASKSGTGQLLLVGNKYDDSFPPSERLPRQFRVEFREKVEGSSTRLEMIYDGAQLGSTLTDNAYTDDGYRFHDVFHLTNAILLGWSPVSRALLKLKRKSVPLIDEVEDGGRAAATEEGISAFVFGFAKDYSFFDGSTSLEYDVVRTIKVMTSPFEVRDRSSREWERAILDGYAVWRQMKKNRGGIFVGDAEQGTVKYEPLPVT